MPEVKSTLVILTWDEIEGLKTVYPKIPFDAVDEYFAVDGGSTDGTLKFYQKHKIPYFVQKKKGRGEAFRLAFRKAKGNVLIFFSPDGNEDPADIPKFLPYFKKGYDMVIASRMMKPGWNEEDGQIIKTRKWANQAFTLIANVFWNRHLPYITDTINGYRAISRKTFKIVNPDASGYAIEYQISIRCFKKKLKIKEIPSIEYPRIGGKSKASSFSTGIKFLKLLAKELFS
jgi:glycosyltransferase involved in cell wall biosynthesis